MKSSIAMFPIAAVVVVAISSCGGGAAGVTTTPAPIAKAQSLDTAQVLAQARVISESGEPYPVNDGALVLTDTSETAESVSIVGP